jgi:hypothetical protein
LKKEERKSMSIKAEVIKKKEIKKNGSKCNKGH